MNTTEVAVASVREARQHLPKGKEKVETVEKESKKEKENEVEIKEKVVVEEIKKKEEQK